MNVSSFTTKDYRKNDDFLVRINKPNSNPISVKPKMNANLYVIEDYENETAFLPQKKQTQNKANSRKAKNRSPENLATPKSRTDSYGKFRWTIPARFWIIVLAFFRTSQQL
jgi:ATP-dependent Zn protease